MGVRILGDEKNAVLYCSTTDWAFGPVFYPSDTHYADERIESFLRWFKKNSSVGPLYYDDPRQLTDSELEGKYSTWLAQEEAQWKAEEVVEEEDE
jgi:hypothetical protein